MVREFAKIAGQVGIAGYDDVVEDASQLILPTRASYGGENRIELFFPFDPYLLRYSHMFIGALYQEWTQDADNDGSEQEYDLSSEGLSIASSLGGSGTSGAGTSGGMGLSFGSGLGSSYELSKSLSETLDQDVPMLSFSPGQAGQSPGFRHVVKRRKF